MSADLILLKCTGASSEQAANIGAQPRAPLPCLFCNTIMGQPRRAVGAIGYSPLKMELEAGVNFVGWLWGVNRELVQWPPLRCTRAEQASSSSCFTLYASGPEVSTPVCKLSKSEQS